jgi:hypothetical protein
VVSAIQLSTKHSGTVKLAAYVVLEILLRPPTLFLPSQVLFLDHQGQQVCRGRLESVVDASVGRFCAKGLDALPNYSTHLLPDRGIGGLPSCIGLQRQPADRDEDVDGNQELAHDIRSQDVVVAVVEGRAIGSVVVKLDASYKDTDDV